MNFTNKINITLFHFLYYLFSILIFDSEAIGRFPRIGRHGSSRTGSKAQEMCERYTRQACRGYRRQLDPPRVNSSRESKRSIINKSHLHNIVGGISATPKEFPHMALVCEDYGYMDMAVICGGTLISENFVLTAAHCVSPQTNMVRLGDYDYATTNDDAVTIDLRVINRYVYPRYNESKILHNDCALLQFRPLSKFTEYYRPICLHLVKHIHYPTLLAVGWGDLKYKGPHTTALRKVELNQINTDQCYRTYRNYHDETELCIGFQLGGKGTCQGDSGGPLQYLSTSRSCSRAPIYMQVGITSGAVECGLKDYPTVFARVSYYIPWIESIVWR